MSQSKSGSVAEDVKFEGDSADDMKFEGDRSMGD
jgi:hypothetical protein